MASTVDLGTTKRKPLTKAQRVAFYERHKGICALCDQKIEAGSAWIDEHMRALGLGGSNDDDNRRPVHVACAAVKTRDEDMPRIVKAKAQKAAHLSAGAERLSPMAGRTPGERRAAREARTAQSGKLPMPPRPHAIPCRRFGDNDNG